MWSLESEMNWTHHITFKEFLAVGCGLCYLGGRETEVSGKMYVCVTTKLQCTQSPAGPAVNALTALPVLPRSEMYHCRITPLRLHTLIIHYSLLTVISSLTAHPKMLKYACFTYIRSRLQHIITSQPPTVTDTLAR